MKPTLSRELDSSNRCLQLSANLKKDVVRREHQAQIERENHMLMQKIHQIMTEHECESATEYLPGVRITKTQRPIVDCHINTTKPTITAGKAILCKSMKFEGWERKYNVHCEENAKMMQRLVARKPVYSRDEWKAFADEQSKHAKNARARDLTAGHLPTRLGSSRRPLTTGSLSQQVAIVPGAPRSRSPQPSSALQHVKTRRHETQSVIVEADTFVDGQPCSLSISELSTSFQDARGQLTHGSSGLLVRAVQDGGRIVGEVVVPMAAVQELAEGKARELGHGALDRISAFLTLLPFTDRPDLFPTFEAAISAVEEMKVSEIIMANTYVARKNERKLKVTVGYRPMVAL